MVSRCVAYARAARWRERVSRAALCKRITVHQRSQSTEEALSTDAHLPRARATRAQPNAYGSGYGTGFLYGTSIGLDRPMVSILLDIKASLDPTNAALGSWRSTDLQPCRAWYGQGASTAPQAPKAWRYVSTAYTSGVLGEYCQDWLPVQSPSFFVALSATSTTSNTLPVGGLSALYLVALSLKGTLPVQLRELRTATQITLRRNLLQGSIPLCWCDTFCARSATRTAALRVHVTCAFNLTQPAHVLQGRHGAVEQLQCIIWL